MPRKTEVPAYERMRRISLAVSPHLDHSMRILGLTPEAIDADGVPADGATEVTAALARYAESIARATGELDRALDRAEWNYLADVLHDCADLWDYSESTIPSLTLIHAEVADAHQLNRTGDKWFGDELVYRSGDKATTAMVKKIVAMSAIHGDAILAAVRWFWRHSQTVDHLEHRWWTIEYRAPRRKGRG
jgi:hypothetical protein